MSKKIYIILMSALILIFSLLTPRGSDSVSIYQDSDSHLLMPQKNVVIVTLNLKENGISFSDMETLNKLKELKNSFQGINGVNSVDSILSASVIMSNNDDIEVKRFIEEGIVGGELGNKINQIEKYPELKPYINSDGTALLFYIYFGYKILPADILEGIENAAESSSLNFYFTGKSPIVSITERLLSKDILVFIPLLFIMIMVIFLSFRSLKAILSAWIIIILSVGLSFSLITYLGVKLTPLILLVPVFSLGLLSDYVIHYFYHLFYEPNRHNSFQVRKNLIYPLGLTALSTLTGFLSLIYINASGHILLGGIIAISVVFSFIGVVLWLPYLNFKIPKKDLLPRFSFFQTKLFLFLYKQRVVLMILLLAGVIWGGLKIPGLRTEPYPVEQLPSSSTVRKAEKIINNDFYGALPFFIEIDSGAANSFLEKDTLLKLEEIHNILNNREEVGYSYSLLTVLKRINYYFMGDEASLLESREYDDFYSTLIEQFLLYYSSSVDPLEYESQVDPSFRFFSVKGYIKYKNVESLNDFYSVIDQINKIVPDNWSLSVNGVVDDLLSEKNGLTQNWIFSFSFGSFLIFITVLLFYRKLKLALLSLLPGFISMVLSFGVISSMGLKVDSFSIIFVAIITGLVIDYSIHTLSALDRVPQVKTIEEGFGYINSYSGIPIFLSFLTSLFAFSVLFLSSFQGARNLGFLLFASLIISYILSLYLLPIIILPSKLKRG